MACKWLILLNVFYCEIWLITIFDSLYRNVDLSRILQLLISNFDDCSISRFRSRPCSIKWCGQFFSRDYSKGSAR